MKSTLYKFYMIVGLGVCLWFTVAAVAGWKAPNLGGSSGYGRGYGGSWGGGK